MPELLADNWSVVTVAEIAAPTKYSCVGGPFGSSLTRKDYVEAGVPVSRGSNLTLGERLFHDDDFVFVSEEKAKSLAQNTAYPGDIVFTQRGTIGQVAWIPKNAKYPKYVLSQNQMKITPDLKKVDVRYVLYYFLSPVAQNLIFQNSIGSTIPGFNLTQLRQFPLPLPPLEAQRAIAHILGTLDDKIELNRRMNETLEEMARALFKSWFIDFEPVRAKMEGRQPEGMDAETAALFPDGLEVSKLGEVPKGWQIDTVVSQFNLTMGQSPPGSTYNKVGEGLPFYQGRSDFDFRYPKRRVFCTAPTRFANSGDTLVSVRAPVGDVNMAAERCCIGRGLAAVRHKSDSRSFTYYTMNSLSIRFAVFESEGTVFGSIGRADFSRLPIIVSSASLVKAFERFAFPLDQRIEVTEGEVNTLTALRDTLLPKLISGELRVPEAESVVEAAL